MLSRMHPSFCPYCRGGPAGPDCADDAVDKRTQRSREKRAWRRTYQLEDHVALGPEAAAASDRFIAALKSRGMLRPGEEWVIEANLAAFAHALAEQQRGVDFAWYEDDASGAEMARDHLADLIDPEVPVHQGNKPHRSS